jgi:FkbM family methyltransferase
MAAKALEATLRANALRQAEVIRCAVGDHDGSVEFSMPVVTSARTDTGTARIGAADCGHEALSVPLNSLDSLIGKRGPRRVDLIKIDVEGHEKQVLDGAETTLSQFRPAMVIETGHEASGDRQAIHDRLRDLGYRMLGILLDYGMAEADWDAYVSLATPFRRGEAHNLLLVPEETTPMRP